MTLIDLPAAYAAARAEASAAAPVVEDVPPNTCRYCGRFLRQWPGTRIDGHGKCIVSLAFQRAVYNLWRTDHTVTVAAIASACDVSQSVVAKWRANVEKQGRQG